MIEDLNQKILLNIIKTFEIEFYAQDFHLLKDSWQPQLREMFKAVIADEPPSLVLGKYTSLCKDENCKTAGYIARFMSTETNHYGAVETKVTSKRHFSKY